MLQHAWGGRKETKRFVKAFILMITQSPEVNWFFFFQKDECVKQGKIV